MNKYYAYPNVFKSKQYEQINQALLNYNLRKDDKQKVKYILLQNGTYKLGICNKTPIKEFNSIKLLRYSDLKNILSENAIWLLHAPAHEARWKQCDYCPEMIIRSAFDNVYPDNFPSLEIERIENIIILEKE